MAEDSWSTKDFKIIQLILDVPEKYRAVWAYPDDPDNNQGPHHLETEEIEALAVAEVTERVFERRRQEPVIIETLNYNAIVVMSLYDGAWQVANEAVNFAGIAMEGDDLARCDYELQGNYYDLVHKNDNGQ